MKSHKQYIEAVGPEAHPRYLIADRDQGTWDGHDWDATRKKHLLFYTFQDAAKYLAEIIQFAEDFDKPQTTYRATVEVCVAGEVQMDPEELRKYLCKATKLCLTQPSPNDETVQVQIFWHDLQPVSERKGASDGQA
jgi:hypothetical protein